MILLDTNVVSALLTPSPDHSLIRWLNRRDTASLYLSTITLAEIGYGLSTLKNDRRRRSLEGRFDMFVREGFQQRIVDFDAEAARQYQEVMGRRRDIGRPMGILQGSIAAIARARHFTVATRQVGDFADCGLELVNPFEDTR